MMKKNHIFVGKAPYNFVPLPEKIIHRYESADDLPTHDASRKEDHNLLSGEITFNIVAENSILVADGQNNGPKQFVINADGKQEIPGSTLRGLIRNAVSVLSLSNWTEQMDDERFYYREIAGKTSTLKNHYKTVLDIQSFSVNGKTESIPQRVKAGYIVKTGKDEYCIYHAKSDGGRHGKTYYKVNNKSLSIRKTAFERNVREGFFVEEAAFSLNQNGRVVKLFHQDASFKGQLLYSGYIQNRQAKKVSAYLINEIDKEKTPIPLRPEDVKAYNADLQFRISTFPGDRRERMRKFFELPEHIGIDHAKPCFYLQYGDITYFGFTAFLRLLFPYSTKDLLPEYIAEKQRGIDYASALFGFATDQESKAKYASRLHFHGAAVKNNVQPLKPVTVQPGNPRASAYRFYLKQDDVKNNDYHTYLTKDTTIRGMKHYWIKDEDPPHVQTTNKKSVTELEFLPKHTTFQAKITFDQLHEDELGLLLWALKGPKYHQIGMGKPYGYGVVSFELLKCFVTANEKMYNDLTDFFQIGQEQKDVDAYIHTYKNHLKELLIKSGYPADDSFDPEDLESIRTFLAMKEKSELTQDNMRYMDLKGYRTATLPSANKLLTSGNRAYKPHQRYEKQTTKPKGRRHQQRHQTRETFAHNPFQDLLKDYQKKNK